MPIHPERLRYMITGLKGEILHEQDQSRKMYLAALGILYTSMLFNPPSAKLKRCKQCKAKKEPYAFGLVINKYYQKKKDVISFNWGHRCICKECENRNRVRKGFTIREEKIMVGNLVIY